MGTLEQAVAFARRHGLPLCHDAPYADVRFDGCRPTSILQGSSAAHVSVEFNSLSKTYNMAGWRIGYAVGNPEAPELLQRINSNADSGWFWPLQYAAVAALGTDEAWIEERNAIYWEWHGILVHALTAVGFVAASPPATPYLQTRISDGEAAEPFALRLLQDTGIAVAPGRSSVWMVRDSCLSQRLLGSSGADPGVEDVCQKAPATRVARFGRAVWKEAWVSVSS